MENASKALLMSASVLIAVMVISIGVYVFNMFGTFAKNSEEELYNKQISIFNEQFVKYETMDNINIHDIITLANYAKNYNETYAKGEEDLFVQVCIDDKTIQDKNIETKNNLIEKSIHNKYKLSEIEYNERTGRVKRVLFIQNK